MLRSTPENSQKGELSLFFTIASDPNRLEILCKLLKSKKCCVSTVAEELGLSIAITSHHLQILAKNGYVVSEREGKRICYRPAKINFIKDLKRLLCKYH